MRASIIVNGLKKRVTAPGYDLYISLHIAQSSIQLSSVSLKSRAIFGELKSTGLWVHVYAYRFIDIVTTTAPMMQHIVNMNMRRPDLISVF
ncbi:hypothetical protein PGT21_013114 [Puccinia graminis f. sp. tritici]|uniref:Uncharacterized protein n=1 Tax=Puccinia graminis f. sp. tritici TaxID=56615 RepID=A0A5B0NHG2_PUCGR|nr:hypothetical protein PGT21_013114 [Puccinia graminis f. sp. tritici]KAA1088046.1 hypothetical protein PGTUg99_023196 [Puccinia graminis f. sp. tritici]